MQIGTRWQVATTPPQALPASVRDAIHEVETELPASGWWTLTWLEGRPVVTSDSGVQLSVDASGHVSRGAAGMPDLGDEDDDWLGA